jgi:hypothetical protein
MQVPIHMGIPPLTVLDLRMPQPTPATAHPSAEGWRRTVEWEGAMEAMEEDMGG